MLKLKNFPRGSNQNRLPKGRHPEIQDEEKNLLLEIHMIFSRFWKNHDAIIRLGQNGEQPHVEKRGNFPEGDS
jgi:hypothetical protein